MVTSSIGVCDDGVGERDPQCSVVELEYQVATIMLS
jgi:hypothetical protein